LPEDLFEYAWEKRGCNLGKREKGKPAKAKAPEKTRAVSAHRFGNLGFLKKKTEAPASLDVF